jgi:DNA-binding NarL/FixJ family response regulator
MTSSAPIRVLIVDDHQIVRSGIRKLLEAVTDFAVIGEAADAASALASIENEQPDIVLMDVAMPGTNGLDAAATIQQRWPHVKVVFLSMYDTAGFVQQAKRLGAAGYVVKDRSPEDLVRVLRQAWAGEGFVSEAYQPEKNGTGNAQPQLSDLTTRQIEVLRELALGLSSREIAQKLHIAEKTVEHHRSRIRQFLGIADMAGLVLFAVKHGLVTPADLENRTKKM